MSTYPGIVTARIIEVRFAISGKVSRVSKKLGDKVKKLDLIASLDRNIFQTELDRQLADFEKTRAEFEIFNQKNPDPESAIDKYFKAGKQAELNASVKDVELAKIRLDQCDLISPIEGVIVDDANLVNGVYTTPSSGTIKIVDETSYVFEFEIPQASLQEFLNPREGTINIDGIGEIKAITKPLISNGEQIIVQIPINHSILFIGLKGEVSF